MGRLLPLHPPTLANKQVVRGQPCLLPLAVCWQLILGCWRMRRPTRSPLLLHPGRCRYTLSAKPKKGAAVLFHSIKASRLALNCPAFLFAEQCRGVGHCAYLLAQPPLARRSRHIGLFYIPTCSCLLLP